MLFSLLPVKVMKVLPLPATLLLPLLLPTLLLLPLPTRLPPQLQPRPVPPDRPRPLPQARRLPHTRFQIAVRHSICSFLRSWPSYGLTRLNTRFQRSPGCGRGGKKICVCLLFPRNASGIGKCLSRSFAFNGPG